MSASASAVESTLIVLSHEPVSVQVASALQSAAAALGYGSGAALLQLDSIEDLKFFVFDADPWAVMAIDDPSIAALRRAFDLSEERFAPDKPAEHAGYRFVAVPGFAACLEDPNAKRVAWGRMQAAAHPGNPLD